MKGERIEYIDALRAVACLAVVMIHSSMSFITHDFGSANFWGGAILDSLSRIGVPLFVMISGALMLDENYSYSTQKNIKHILKLIRFFFVWSTCYSLFFNIGQSLISDEKIDLINIVKELIKGNYHLWFVYMIIGLYILIPLLRLWVRKENTEYVRYFLILSLLFNFLVPQVIEIGFYCGLKFEVLRYFYDKLNLKYVCGYTTYFIAGWYLRFNEIKNKRSLYFLGVLGVVFSILMTYLLSVRLNEVINVFSNMYLNVFFPSIAVFVIFKDKNIIINGLTSVISKYSLGIYAIHVGVISCMHFVLIKKWNIVNAFICIPFMFIIAVCLSLLLSMVIAKFKSLKGLVI